jgi:hypothetical protein
MTNEIMDYIVDGNQFGFIDNVVLVLGAFTGLRVERYLPFKTVGIGAVLGAGVGNAFSDLLGGLAIHPVFALSTFTGCLLGLVVIPVFVAMKKGTG